MVESGIHNVDSLTTAKMDSMPRSVFFLALVSCLFWIIEGRTIRLVTKRERTSSSLTAGRLEVYYNQQWGTVCDDGFGGVEARVACRQLGFSSYLGYGTVDSSSFGFDAASESTPIWLDDLSCSSSDTSLSQCSHSSVGVHDCSHREDIAISCLGSGALRLSGSYSSSRASSGRLEVYHSGRWGTVCDDSFDKTDADVACRQLGFASALRYGNVGSLGYSQGSSTSTIWLDDLHCTSFDLMLSTCSHNGFGNENCRHSEDVAVSCSSTDPVDTIRLVTKGEHTSPSLIAGRLEVYHNGQWGTVCNDEFSYTEARVACRQLGFTSHLSYGTVGNNLVYNRFDAASSSTPIWLSGLSCYSSDSSLTDCRHDTFGVNSCTHSQDVALFCQGNGALRLGRYYSSSVSIGRLEIYYNGEWGTVCDDFFDQTDADVACRQLGFSLASNYGTVGSSEYSSYSQGSGTIWLDNLQCTSSDLMLATCSHNGFGNEDCSHSEDVVVSCSHSTRDTIRLVTKGEHTSLNLTAGRLEVYHNGEWGTVCNDQFTYTEAGVACRQLGFSSYLGYGRVGSNQYLSDTYRFDAAPTSTPIWLSGLSCSSYDNSLSRCSHNVFGVNYCTHIQDVALVCQGNGALRLGGYYSSYTSSGRLEIYYNGEWGTVCDDFFNQTDANVACRQLGFDSASNYGNVDSLGFSEGSGTIWLDDLQCTSSDFMLSECSHSGFGYSDCSHSEDVVLYCTRSTSVTPTRSTSSINLSFGAIFGIVVAVVIVFLVLIISIISCAVRANRVQGSRLQNIRRGTAAANSNFPATILMSSNANTSSSNFAYAPLPQEPPPPYPGSPTNPDFAGQTQPQVQQPVSSYEYPQEHPTQLAPYGTSAPYPQPMAESGGAAPTAPGQPHSESNNNEVIMQSQDHYEDQPPGCERTAPTIPSIPDQLPYPLSDLVYPPTPAGVASYPTAAAGDSDTNPQPPLSN